MSPVHDLLPHMRHVMAADRELHDLNMMWTLIEASSAIGCPEQAESILPTLSQTRSSFGALQRRLVDRLGQENVAALGDELASIGQCTIDILVRNLFERTADVGFLATDDVLRDFCRAADEARDAARPALLRRLNEYRAKYTVYDDIVALAPDGRVLARLDDTAGGPLHSTDPVIAQALSRDGYVERHGVSDLGPADTPVLLYAHRIVGDDRRPLGVLVLRFRLADEMAHIFAGMAGTRLEIALMLVDADDRVILSNDPAHVPVGAQLRPMPPGQVGLTTFAGREYLAMNCPARPYQGYPGPGWRAQAMVSLLVAFRPAASDAAAEQGVSLDNTELRTIQGEVDAINRNLRRVVWNGRIMAGGNAGAGQAQLKAVLQQVNLAGARMRDRVGAAISDLYRTALGRARHQAAEMAHLAVDVMDRNLYERANDCRWWALSPVLREGLAGPVDDAARERMAATLRHINGLYTVYGRLVVFDAAGVIQASSRPEDDATLVGQPIDPRWRDQTLRLSDSQHYAVSGFEASALSDGLPSYVYLASIRAPSGGAVGGIAIAFNAAREFNAMLADVRGGHAGVAAFVDAQGQVLASTDPTIAVGARWPLDLSAGVVGHDGAHHAVGVCSGRGYREFKRSDGYDNHVRAVVLLRLGQIERRRIALYDQVLQACAVTGTRGRTRELAAFQVGPGRYALPTLAVLEACTTHGLVPTRTSHPLSVGLLALSRSGPAGRVVPVFCARRLLGLSHPARAGDGVVLLMADPADHDRVAYGLRVDDVNAVVDVPEAHLQEAPAGLRGHAPWLHGLVRLRTGDDPADEVLAQLLDPQRLADLLLPTAELVA